MELQKIDFVHIDPVTEEQELVSELIVEFAVMIVLLVGFVVGLFWSASW